MRKNVLIMGTVALSLFVPGLALAQEAELSTIVAANAANDAFVFNTLLFLIGGVLVMWMAAGFAYVYGC